MKDLRVFFCCLKVFDDIMFGLNVNLKMERLKLKKLCEFDDILDMVGGFGCYSLVLYVFMCIMFVLIGF